MEKILIIDDFEPVRKTIRRIVEREKFVAIQAVDGKEGLEVFEKEKPDVIITDLKMPNIDGKGVLCAVKDQSPETEVIVLTGYGDSETANFLLKKGAFRYLKKPLDLQQLVKILNEVREKIRSKNPQIENKTQGQNVIHVSLSEREEVILNWGDSTNNSPGSIFTHQIPIPLVIVNQNLDVIFSNDAMKNVVGDLAHKLTLDELDALKKAGFPIPNSTDLNETFKKIFTENQIDVSQNEIDSYKNLGILKATLSKDQEKMPILILFFPPK